MTLIERDLLIALTQAMLRILEAKNTGQEIDDATAGNLAYDLDQLLSKVQAQ